MDKGALRRVFLRKRKTLTKAEYNRRNAFIIDYFKKSFKFEKNENIHSFIPIVKNKEVDTWPIIKHIYPEHGNIVVSRIDPSKNSMDHFKYSEGLTLKTNRWGIPEPQDGERVGDLQIDVILIPLIICDKLGNRIGYGKGYYDILLSKCRPEVKKIGLSLAPLVDKIDFMEPFDVPLDYCISPNGLHVFKDNI